MKIFIDKELVERTNRTLDKLNQIVTDLNKENKALYEENKHLRALLGLYEAAMTHGIKVDFPNSTKGDEEAPIDGQIDFDDF